METNLKLCIASDLAGYDLKMEMLRRMRAKGYLIDDLGCDNAQAGDYHIYAQRVGRAVVAGTYDRGILICGTGQGMAIAANKVNGVRAALCFQNFAAIMSREHNNANVFATGAWLVTPDELERVLEVWLFGKYAGGKHERRVNGIAEIERQQAAQPLYRDAAVLSLPRERLQNGNIPVALFADEGAVFAYLAAQMAATIRQNNAAGKPTLMIVPLGPVGQYPLLAETINRERLSLQNVTFLNMDEYMQDQQTLIDRADPLSFRGAMDRVFYQQVAPALLMPPQQRVFPQPDDLAGISALIAAHGGVDLCVGGIGINGHIAFNEPAPGMAADAFRAQPARVVPIAPETIVINALNEFGGAYEFMPRWAVTLGFAELLAAKRILLGCFRPWHRMVVHKAAVYPPSAEFPVSLLGGRDVTICIPEALA